MRLRALLTASVGVTGATVVVNLVSNAVVAVGAVPAETVQVVVRRVAAGDAGGLSRVLAERVREVVGVDASRPMMDLRRRRRD